MAALILRAVALAAAWTLLAGVDLYSIPVLTDAAVGVSHR